MEVLTRRQKDLQILNILSLLPGKMMRGSVRTKHEKPPLKTYVLAGVFRVLWRKMEKYELYYDDTGQK
jgi:hypothetical protein